jgi:hypothetical protein
VTGNAKDQVEQKKDVAQEKVEQKKDNVVSQTSSSEGNKAENAVTNAVGNPTEPGGIVFSSLPINPDQPADLKTEFQAGDKIYTVAYLPKTVNELYNNTLPNAKLDVEVFIYEIKPPLYSYQQPREEQLTFASMKITGKALNYKYLVIDLVPDPENTTAYGTPEIIYKEFGKKFDGPVNFAEALGKLAAGEHKLKILVKCNYQDVATRELKINGNDFSSYNKLAEQLNSAAQSAGAKNTFLPNALMTNAATEAKMIAAFKNSNDWKTGWIDGTEVLKIAIVDADWYIRRHEISGAILHRYIRAAIAFKTKDNKCAYRQITFQEDYVGGKFQPLRYDGAGDKMMMDCANLK